MKNSEHLKRGLIKFTIDVLALARKLPKTNENIIFFKQLVRSASSKGANYSEAIFAHTRTEFIHCLNISRKETNETTYWLEILKETSTKFEHEINILLSEANEILRIFISSIKTSKLNDKQ